LSLRCFVAFDLSSPEIAEKIVLVQRELESQGIDGKPVDPEIIHLTLQFLGEISPEYVRMVSEQLSSIIFRPFTARLRGVGFFPGGGRINVVWVGVEEPEGILHQVQREVSSRLSKLGLRPDKEFKPHVTIYRVKSVRNKPSVLSLLERLKEQEFGEVYVDKLKLKKSTLTPQGPIYEDLLVVEAKK
jgi:2'-5' RNA ligase